MANRSEMTLGSDRKVSTGMGLKAMGFWPLLLSFPRQHFLPLKLQCAVLILSGKVRLQGEELKLLQILRSYLNKLLQLPLWPRCTFKQL